MKMTFKLALVSVGLLSCLMGGTSDSQTTTTLEPVNLENVIDGTVSPPEVEVEKPRYFNPGCRSWEFRCSESFECLPPDRYCNGLIECPNGEDEPAGCSPCNKTYYGEVGRTYELEVRRPSEDQLPFLCHLNFTAGGRSMGELVQITFEAFSVGTFESFTLDGCPDGHVSIAEWGRPSTGGQWCGSAWGYTVYYSETPSVNLTLQLTRLLPPQHLSSGYTFEFRLFYKFLRLIDARIRYGNTTAVNLALNGGGTKAESITYGNSSGATTNNSSVNSSMSGSSKPASSSILPAESSSSSANTVPTSTSRFYRGRLHSGSYCDRVLENCSRKQCRVQSPNYPGIYQRNLTCSFRIRERNVPKGKHALIAVRQSNNGHHSNHQQQQHGQQRNNGQLTKFDNSDTAFRIWDRCNVVQDFIEIRDGDKNAPVLAHLCSGETVPEIISSGPEMLVKFHTSPYGNPFHPLPLSHLPGFELEVQVYFVDKESPTYIEHGKKCEFFLNTFDNSSGLLESPMHSIPPNTTCHYRFKGQKNEVVWLSFIKYHVPNELLLFDTSGDCDVQLQLWDGDVKGHETSEGVPLMGQFCRDDKPKLCDHTLLSNSSRKTRPCDITESYVSTGPELTVAHSIRYSNVLYPVSFVLRYEFVDLSQEGTQLSINPCDRIFKAGGGRFYSPKITFLYGRGGQRNLNCAYHFESPNEKQRLEITFNRAGFGKKGCSSSYNRETGRYQCHKSNYLGGVDSGIAHLSISEQPWPGIEILRDCVCQNISEPLVISTNTGKHVVVKFTVTDMSVTDDYEDYYFDATFKFVAHSDNLSNGCINPWKSRRLKGSSGEITVRNGVNGNKYSLEETSHGNHSNSLSSGGTGGSSVCTHQPWLIEPEDPMANFIYLKVKGAQMNQKTTHQKLSSPKNSTQCATKNRILVYSVGMTDHAHVICPLPVIGPEDDSNDGVVELFSEGWSGMLLASIRKEVQMRHSRSFIIEFLQREPGNFAVTWMEVSKNPALTLPRSMLMISPPDCPHSCPELGACISPELWCDGLRHCPSGNDEREVNCAIRGGFPLTLLNSAFFIAALVAFLVLASGLSLCFWKYQKHRREHQKNVIVSVTEHTFLEFKSGLC